MNPEIFRIINEIRDSEQKLQDLKPAYDKGNCREEYYFEFNKRAKLLDDLLELVFGNKWQQKPEQFGFAAIVVNGLDQIQNYQ